VLGDDSAKGRLLLQMSFLYYYCAQYTYHIITKMSWWT